MSKFCVYLLTRTYGACLPAYVGKGQKYRPQEHKRLYESKKGHVNKHLHAVFRKCGGSMPVTILWEGDDEQEAFAQERAHIARIGRADLSKGPLCNWTDGGQGASGFKHRFDCIKNLGEIRRGENHPMYGRHHTEESKLKISKTRLERPIIYTEELRKKFSEGSKGRPQSQETRQKQAQAKLGNQYSKGCIRSPETKAKMSEARRRAWERRRQLENTDR